jgi:hypothetical protein
MASTMTTVREHETASRIKEVRLTITGSEFSHATKSMATNAEKAVWLVDQKGYRIHDVAVALGLTTNVVRSAIGAVHEGREVGHVGRPRTLHEQNEAELVRRIDDAHSHGNTLTKSQCLEIANEIYQQQLEADRAAGRINPEKEIEWEQNPPHLSTSFIGSFLGRYPYLHTHAAHEMGQRQEQTSVAPNSS